MAENLAAIVVDGVVTNIVVVLSDNTWVPEEGILVPFDNNVPGHEHPQIGWIFDDNKLLPAPVL